MIARADGPSSPHFRPSTSPISLHPSTPSPHLAVLRISTGQHSKYLFYQCSVTVLIVLSQFYAQFDFRQLISIHNGSPMLKPARWPQEERGEEDDISIEDPIAIWNEHTGQLERRDICSNVSKATCMFIRAQITLSSHEFLQENAHPSHIFSGAASGAPCFMAAAAESLDQMVVLFLEGRMVMASVNSVTKIKYGWTQTFLSRYTWWHVR